MLSRQKNKLLFYLPLIITLLAIFVMGLQKNYSPDAGFHLRSAQWMLEHHKLISEDSFTYTSAGNTYFDLQWLYQLFIYFVYKAGGDGLLIIVNAVLILLALVLVYIRYTNEMKEKQNLLLFSFFLLIAVQALPFEIRPHVVSWVFLSLIILLLQKHKSESSKQVYLVPLVLLVWVNSHSLAILGLVTVLIYVIGARLEKKQDKLLEKIALVSLVVFFINPYFTEGFLFPFKQFGILNGSALQKQYIGEMQSPFTLHEFKQQGPAYLLNPLFYLQVYALLTFWAGIKIFLKKEYTNALLIGAFFIILCMAMKNYGYFVIASFPLTAKYYGEWLKKRRAAEKTKGKRFSSVAYPAICIWAVTIILTTFTDGYSLIRHSPYRFGLSVDEAALPVDAVRYLNNNRIYGKILNHLDFGGYLMYNYPEKVFIDGRMELPSENFFRSYFNSLKPGGIKKLIAEYDPEIIIFPYMKATGWWASLLKTKNYRAVYFDGLAAIYLRKDKFTSIPPVDPDANRHLDKTTIINSLGISKPELPTAFFRSFFQKQYYPLAEQNMATFCFTCGFDTAALDYSIQGLKKATVNPKNIFQNLKLYFQHQGRYNEAALCAAKAKN